MKRVIKLPHSDSYQLALDCAQLTYKYGRYFTEDDFDGDIEAYRFYFDELLSLGPARFYEEYKDQLDFSDDFISEYEYDEYDEDETEDW